MSQMGSGVESGMSHAFNSERLTRHTLTLSAWDACGAGAAVGMSLPVLLAGRWASLAKDGGHVQTLRIRNALASSCFSPAHSMVMAVHEAAQAS
ncbi:hypothetical protein E2C01_070192 [Portunus trituberculatus]|uniref:Uncharacterized protein n=1 Tax=Portunus trituberculatus TaxID=210409 RepID=A0A5B7I1G7_PORTR|nr:hypothetical protein [Portunus trituberculatus]